MQKSVKSMYKAMVFWATILPPTPPEYIVPWNWFEVIVPGADDDDHSDDGIIQGICEDWVDDDDAIDTDIQ